MTVAGGRGATFGELFRIGEFRVLFGSQLLLTLSESVKMLAFSVIVFERTDSAGLSAISWMLGFLPMMLGGLFLASMADRIRPRSLMITGELVRVVVCLLLAFAGLPVWAMFAVVLVTGVPTAVFMAARNAVLPEVLEGDRFVLGRALFTMTGAGSQIAGLAVGGAMLALTGPRGRAAGHRRALAGRGAAHPVRPGRPAAARGQGRHRRGPRHPARQLGAAERPDHPGSAAGRMAAADVHGRLGGGLHPLSDRDGPGRGGRVRAGRDGGRDGVRGVRRRPVRAARHGANRLGLPLVALMGVPLIGFVAAPGPWWAGILAFLAGCGLAYQLVLQRPFVDAVPEERRGLAFGLQGSGMMTVQGLGGVVAGGLAEVVDVHHAIAICGGLVIVAGALLWRPLARPS